MKKKHVYIIALLFSCMVFSQSPNKMSYQAIVRNASSELVADSNIGIQISIIKQAVSGTAVYVETHAVNTNANGLITIQIGAGSPISGVFSDIEWGSDSYFIKSEIDLTGGSNYTISGTSELLSVPYALYAKEAKNVTTYNIGDFAHGGVVFWLDETKQHGLVCSKNNTSNATKWFAGQFGVTRSKGNGIYAGKSNTNIIITSHIAFGDNNNDYAASLCNGLQVVENSILYGDWYLPSAFELKLISQNIALINETAEANSGESFTNSFYWSSSEENSSKAFIINVFNSQESSVLKSSENPVRAVRSF